MAVVDAPAAVAFAVSQTYGEVRYRWDPFVREQRLLDHATAAGKGVRTWTRFVADPLGSWLLRRDISRRIDAFARACADPTIVAAVAAAQP